MTKLRTCSFVFLVFLVSCFSTQAPEEEVFTPNFPPTPENSYFFETFEGDWKSRWILSRSEEHTGTFDVRRGQAPYGTVNMPALTTLGTSMKHGITAVLPKELSFKDEKIIIQYEVRGQKDWTCSGAYMKLYEKPSDGSDFDPKKVDGETPYTIMFGPDKCGSSDVHFIFRHQNPVNGEFEEKHLSPKPSFPGSDRTHLFTLVLNPDNTFEVSVNRQEASRGSLLKNFDPPVNPPKTLDDPEDVKPEDWVDEKEIDDPSAVKPEDWVDEKEIIDSSASKPEDWDDDEDGEWVPPTILNPNFKGEWQAPKIKNPDYKGPWKPRQIDNPNYFEDLTPMQNLRPITAVGFEIWAVNNLVSFGNIIITSDEKEAELWADNWSARSDQEDIIEEREYNRKPTLLEKIVEYVKENLLIVSAAIVIPVIMITFAILSIKKSDPVAESKKDDDSKLKKKDSDDEEEVKEVETKEMKTKEKKKGAETRKRIIKKE